jgi:hypothetical protein
VGPSRCFSLARGEVGHLRSVSVPRQVDRMARSADPEAEAEARQWIEGVLDRSLEGETLHDGLKSGIALCE